MRPGVGGVSPTSHPFDLGGFPNREGYLMLGGCTRPTIALSEECDDGPADPPFGVLQCRCVKSRWKFGHAEIIVGSRVLKPRDKVRLQAKFVLECQL